MTKKIKFNHKELNNDGSPNYYYFIKKIEKHKLTKSDIEELKVKLAMAIGENEFKDECAKVDTLLQFYVYTDILANWDDMYSLVTSKCLVE